MTDDESPVPLAAEPPGGATRRRAGRILAGTAVGLALVLGLFWSQRERIAGNLIGKQLERYDVPATYRIVSLGPRRQVLSDIVVGDPASPDLTIERAEITLRYRLGYPEIASVRVTRPRLYGTYLDRKLSFGRLDPVLFGGPKKPFALPALNLALVDGRALLETDFGAIGVKAEGHGRIDDGFKGIVAIAAPGLAAAECQARRTTFYGSVSTRNGKPSFDGPLRIAGLDCPDRDLQLETASARTEVTLDRDLKGGEGSVRLLGGALDWGGYRTAGSDLTVRATYRRDTLTAKVGGGIAGVTTPQLAAGRLETDGTLRATKGFAQLEYRGSLEGSGLRLGTRLDRTLVQGQDASAGTLLAPLIGQARAALAREAKGGRLTAEVDVRRDGASTRLIVPQANLTGGRGTRLAALSRLSVVSDGRGPPLIAGNFVTGGPGLPRLSGRMERHRNGGAVLRLAMGEYRAGNAVLAIPQLSLVQARDGSLGFAGRARASGPLPGGSATNLALPVDGQLAANGDLALWRGCTAFAFDRLQIANLALSRRALTLCPQRGRSIARFAGGRLAIAAGAPSLELAGSLGETPIRLASGPVGFAYPGAMSAQRVDVALGPAQTASRFRISNLDARIGKQISGTFAGADVRLAATPLDLIDADGRWRYANGRLGIAGANFRLVDRLEPARFAPLSAQAAELTLFDNTIDASALLRHAASGREVAQIALRHDLETARGHASFTVDGLRFEPGFQPEDLSQQAKGTIALAKGTVTGAGRIDWNGDRVTSRGRFSTNGLDFAAAFGPVTGLSGTVEFTDLLGLVTAPDQEVTIASLNPGIEVTEGTVRFQLEPGSRLALKSASWPFLGGRLSLAPTTLNLGVAEARRYTLVIDGLDAARFVERMELGNLQATGTFDGQLPLVFGAANPGEQVAAAVGTVLGVGTRQGVEAAQSTPGSGRIVDGYLRSRPPGGNVSYVGELTYRDLSAMANFAFQTLRSLDYRTMDITLNGSLEGEIITNVRFDGVRQGAGAKKNFLTRAVADLPIQMNVNIRAPFYQLITSFKALYDPAFVKDPRSLGLIDAAGRPIARPPPSLRQPGIQPSESEKRP